MRELEKERKRSDSLQNQLTVDHSQCDEQALTLTLEKIELTKENEILKSKLASQLSRSSAVNQLTESAADCDQLLESSGSVKTMSSPGSSVKTMSSPGSSVDLALEALEEDEQQMQMETICSQNR